MTKPPRADSTPVRAVVELTDLGWTPEEIAAGLKVSLSTVYLRLKRAAEMKERHRRAAGDDA